LGRSATVKKNSICGMFFMNIPIKYASNAFCESEVTKYFVGPKF